MKRLLIVNAGEFGRVVLDWILAIPPEQRDWQVGGFLDDRPSILENYKCDYRIIGSPFTFKLSESDCLICAIYEPKLKLEYCRKLKECGAKFITLVHPTAIIGSSCSLGEGTIIGPGAWLMCNATLGSFVTLNPYAGVGHDTRIGDGCTLSPQCTVAGWITLDEGVLVGTHSSIMPNITVNQYAVIGAGSAVFGNVSSNTTVVGVPAKKLPR